MVKFKMIRLVTVLPTIKTDKHMYTKLHLTSLNTDKSFLKAQPAKVVTIWIVTKVDL